MTDSKVTPQEIEKMAEAIGKCLAAGKTLQQALTAVNEEFPEALDRIFPERSDPNQQSSLGDLNPLPRKQQITSQAARGVEFCIRDTIGMGR